MTERELTDAELEAVAAGKGPAVVKAVTGTRVLGAGFVFGRERPAASAPASPAGGCANGRCSA